MSIIADAIQPLIPSGILNVAGKLEKTTASDALILGKAGYNVNVNYDGSIVLDFRDDQPLSQALCCDCSLSQSFPLWVIRGGFRISGAFPVTAQLQTLPVGQSFWQASRIVELFQWKLRSVRPPRHVARYPSDTRCRKVNCRIFHNTR